MSISEQIVQSLQSQQTYKELQQYKQAILEEDESVYDPVCNAIEMVLQDSNSSPMSQLLACRLAKDAMDQHNLSYSLVFNESNAFKLIAKISEFKMGDQNDDRGNQYFGSNVDKKTQQIGNSLLRMCLDSISTWAKWVPLDLEDNLTNFYITYATLLQKKVKIPKLTYYKESDVSNFIDKSYKDPDLSKNYSKKKEKQQEKQQQQQQEVTPTPGDNVSQSTVIKQVNLTLAQCQQHKRQIAKISASISGQNYPYDELSQPMEWVQTFLSSVEELIDGVLMEEQDQQDVDDTLAMKLVEEQEYFQGMSQDYKNVTWKEFRKKYMLDEVDQEKKVDDDIQRQIDQERQRHSQYENIRKSNEIEDKKQQELQKQKEEEKKRQQEIEEMRRQQELLEEQRKKEEQEKQRKQLEEKERQKRNEEKEKEEKERIQQLEEQNRRQMQKQRQDEIMKQQEELLRKQNEAEKKQQKRLNEEQELLREIEQRNQWQSKQDDLNQQEKERRREKELANIQKLEQERQELLNERMKQETKFREHRINQKIEINEDLGKLKVYEMQIQQMKNEKQLMNEEINSLKEANDKFQLDFKREKQRREILIQQNQYLKQRLIDPKDKDMNSVIDLNNQKMDLNKQVHDLLDDKFSLEHQISLYEHRIKDLKNNYESQLVDTKNEKLHLELLICQLKEDSQDKDSKINELDISLCNFEKQVETQKAVITTLQLELINIRNAFTQVQDLKQQHHVIWEQKLESLQIQFNEHKQKMMETRDSHENEILELTKYYNDQIEAEKDEKAKLQNDVMELQEQLYQMQSELKDYKLAYKNQNTLNTISYFRTAQQQQTNPPIQEVNENSVKSAKSERSLFSQIPHKLESEMNLSKQQNFEKNKDISQTENITISKKIEKLPYPTYKALPENIFLQENDNFVLCPKKEVIITNNQRSVLFFPYTSAFDYYNNKTKKPPKGTLINYTGIDVKLKGESKELFKRRLLGLQGLLYVNKNKVMVGCNWECQQYQNKNYFKCAIYIQNESESKMNVKLSYPNKAKFQLFWMNQQIQQSLQQKQQCKQEVVVDHKDKIQPIIQLNVQYNETQIMLLLPNSILAQCQFQQEQGFKSRWRSYFGNILRTVLFPCNKNLIRGLDDLQKYFPKLSILNGDKMHDYEIGLDEIKIGGLCLLYQIQFLIKLELTPTNMMMISCGFAQQYGNQKLLIDRVMNTLQFIFRSDLDQD